MYLVSLKHLIYSLIFGRIMRNGIVSSSSFYPIKSDEIHPYEILLDINTFLISTSFLSVG